MRLGTATATALASLLLVAGCGSGTTAEPAAAPPSPATPPATAGHAGHGNASAPPPAPLRPGETFVDLAMPQAYRPAAPNGGTDEYRCFVVDPKLTEPAFLTGSQFLPQNAAIVHHAIFYRLSPEQATEAATVDAGTPGQGWTCFGGAGVGGQTAWVAHWAPGAGETLMPDGFGFEMAPGSKLVMQVHYNLLGVDSATPATDKSGIQVRLSTEPRKKLETALAFAPIELPCEPGGTGPLCDRATAVADVEKRFGAESGGMVQELSQMCKPVAGSTQHCDQPIDQAGTIYMAAGHMHLLGRAIKVEINPGTPRVRTVIDVPSYDFDNQALVALPKPVAVERGDTVRVTCTHDATLRKQLPQLKTLPPRYVVWGEGTSDEMCLGIMVFAPKE